MSGVYATATDARLMTRPRERTVLAIGITMGVFERDDELEG